MGNGMHFLNDLIGYYQISVYHVLIINNKKDLKKTLKKKNVLKLKNETLKKIK
jgi:hypothetical protein